MHNKRAHLLILGALPSLLSAASIDHVFDCSQLPDRQPVAWRATPQSGTSITIQDGVLRVADDGTTNGQLQFISSQWSADPDAAARVDVDVKVVRCSGPAGVVLLAANGRHEAALTMYPDRIEAHRLGASTQVRLDDSFHHVALFLHGRDLRVSVDGKPAIDMTGKWEYPAHEGRNLVGFGSLSSQATGEALWKSVVARTTYPDVIPYAKAEHHIVYRKPGVYACFPSVARTGEGWLVARFGTRTLRSHIDPTGGTGTRISKDGGRTWLEPDGPLATVTPGMLRADGNLATAGAIGWRHVPESEKTQLEAKGLHARSSMKGMVAYASGAHFSIKTADGKTVKPWTPIEMPRHRLIMGYNQSANLHLGAGHRLVAIYGETPDYRRDAYVLRSTDDGDSWTCVTLAQGLKDIGFNEPALGTNAVGHVIALLRTAETPRDRGFLYQSLSRDRGQTWSAPENSGMWGYPAHILTLPDGRIVATYGYRRAPMGIRATLSDDGGKTWNANATVVLRADGRGNGSDLGYPISTLLEDGTIVTVYYFNDAENVTHVAATRWQPPQKNP